MGQTNSRIIQSYSQTQLKPSKLNAKEKSSQKGRSYKLDLTNVIRYWYLVVISFNCFYIQNF